MSERPKASSMPTMVTKMTRSDKFRPFLIAVVCSSFCIFLFETTDMDSVVVDVIVQPEPIRKGVTI